ncbi:MAG TPA: histidine kinase [Streptosporangiaceae bacterium]|nr:histidine kinase [Streptosporangiaceae bacterium]
MNSDGPGTLTLATLRQTRAQRQAMLRRVLPVALIALIIGTVRSTPAPGVHGARLGVLIVVVGLAAVVVGSVLARDSLPIQIAVFGMLLACSAVLVWLQPSGPGTIGLFLAVGLGARLMNSRWSLLLALAAGVSILTLIVLQGAGLYASKPGLGVPGVVIVAAMLVTVAFGRRVQVQDEQADQMLVELEQTRGAELRAATLAERQRLAREMHDVLAHSLSGLVMQLEGARLLAASDPADPRLASTIDRAHHLAKSGLGEARRAISMLRDDELPSPERIEVMATEFARDSGVPCQFVTVGPARDVSSETRLALYRVAQEALTNIRKHAHPGKVEVTLTYRPQTISLVVEDFQAAAPVPPVTGGTDGGYGLTGMRERAELLGGTLVAAPTECGFRVELRVPA